MNRQGIWDWKLLLALVMAGMVVGLACGQTRGIWTHDYGRTGDFTLWGVHDDLHGIICYSLVPYQGNVRAGAAISCVKVEGKL